MASSTSRRRRMPVALTWSDAPSSDDADTHTTRPFRASLSRSDASRVRAWYHRPRSRRAPGSHTTRGLTSMAIIDLKNHQRHTDSGSDDGGGNGDTVEAAASTPCTSASASPRNISHGMRYSGSRPRSMSGERRMVPLASAIAVFMRASGSRSSSGLPGPRSPMRLELKPRRE